MVQRWIWIWSIHFAVHYIHWIYCFLCNSSTRESATLPITLLFFKAVGVECFSTLFDNCNIFTLGVLL
jgi:hypothetical protein